MMMSGIIIEPRLYLVGNQEGGVEAHAEAADEVGVPARLLLLLQHLRELGGAGPEITQGSTSRPTFKAN